MRFLSCFFIIFLVNVSFGWLIEEGSLETKEATDFETKGLKELKANKEIEYESLKTYSRKTKKVVEKFVQTIDPLKSSEDIMKPLSESYYMFEHMYNWINNRMRYSKNLKTLKGMQTSIFTVTLKMNSIGSNVSTFSMETQTR